MCLCASVKNGSDCLSAQGLEKGFLSRLRAKLAEWLGLCGVSYRVSRQSCRILKAVRGIILLRAQTCRKRVRLLDMIFTVSGRRSEQVRGMITQGKVAVPEQPTGGCSLASQ